MRTWIGVLGLVLAVGCASPEAAREHEKEAAAHIQAGRIEDAVRELEAAIEEDPGAAAAASLLASLYERAGAAGTAVEILRSVLREKPNAQIPRMNLARILAKLGDFDNALQQYAIAATSGREPHAPAFVAIADIHVFRKDPVAAEQALRQALDADRTNVAARYRLARLYDTHASAEARAAWERYMLLAIGIPEERERIDEAKVRLQVLGARLSPEEKTALFATLRTNLNRGLPVHRGSLALSEAQPVADDPGPRELQRIFSGRMIVTLYARGLERVRGFAEGATLYEAVTGAVEDLARNRVFDLYYANALAQVRVEVCLESGAPEPLTTETELRPEDVVELRTGKTTVFVLPSDRAARGLTTAAKAIDAAALEVGLAPESRRGAVFRRFTSRGMTETTDGGGAVFELDGGLPMPPAPSRANVLEAVRGGAEWLLVHVTPDGVMRWTPGPSATEVATATARAQAYAIIALADAAKALGDDRYAGSARLAWSWLAKQPASRSHAGPAARASLRVAGLTAYEISAAPLVTSDRFEETHAAEEAALAFAESPAYRDRAIAILAELARPAAATATAAYRGAKPQAESPREIGSAAYIAAFVLGHDPGFAPRAGDDAGAIQANLALGLLRSKTPAGRRLFTDAVRAALRLSIDDTSAHLYADRGRVIGAFREDRFDPRISLEETARLVSALASAAATLPDEPETDQR